MTNMSYCQFENTANDLQQVYNTLLEGKGEDSTLSKYEKNGKEQLIQLCRDILDLVENESFDEEREIDPDDEHQCLDCGNDYSECICDELEDEDE